MAMKRKFVMDSEDAIPTNAKQLKLIPFPNVEQDNDAVMSEAEPLYSPYHVRIPSNASSASTESPITHPTFDIRPLPFFNPDGTVNPESHSFHQYASQSPTQTPTTPVGLMQPSSFMHHGTNCTQIPKLRVACASSSNGPRTMWAFCEQCGAISMVDNND